MMSPRGTAAPARPYRYDYEKIQEFNRITVWLHSHRYKAIIDFFARLCEEISDRPIRVLEIGAAHAKLYGALNERFNIDYTGIELLPSFRDVAQKRYGDNPNFRMITGNAADRSLVENLERPDVVVALETFEHIPEHAVVRIIENLTELQPSYLVCSVPVEVGPIVWVKNLGSLAMRYYRHREYRWQETLWAGLYQLDKLPPHDIGHKGFDWRWLAQTIRHNARIVDFRKIPFRFLPAGLSTSVFFVCRPRHKNGASPAPTQA